MNQSGKPERVDSAREAQCGLALVETASTVSGTRVSTIFLGVDHDFYNPKQTIRRELLIEGVPEAPSEEHHPIVFETMVFRGDTGVEQERTRTLAEAVAVHEKLVREYLRDERTVVYRNAVVLKAIAN